MRYGRPVNIHRLGSSRVKKGGGTVETITLVIAVVALVISIAALVQAVKKRK
ncbi:hypothetical protein C2W64_01912 [Brevibacillus laterosporus]|nr:hypothetical protein [Brevibacillus laterosporus]RAP30716.1 hypothetical protein C2W64_01912 [Brevibacillus laterosporus]